MINLIAGKEIAKVSSQAAGCTPTIQAYKIQSAGDTYTIWDTPGLNEGEEGNVPTQEVFKQLNNLITRSRINLIVYCLRGSRLTGITQVNYDLFHGIMCEGMVPIVLVVTGLELENDMDQWWNRNAKVIEDMGMTFEGYACVTTIRNGANIYGEKFRVSQDMVWALLKEHTLSVPWTPRQKWHAEVPQKMDAYMKQYRLRTGKEKKLLPIVERKQTLSASDPSKSVRRPLSIEMFRSSQCLNV